jgi:gamma-glutamyl-gamma-aminobutyrate hydrolase PuuD
MACVAEADDGVMEGIADVGRRFYVGVQWHPERTGGELGDGVFGRLVEGVRV